METSAVIALINGYKFNPRSTKLQDANGADVSVVKDDIGTIIHVRSKSLCNSANIVKI